MCFTLIVRLPADPGHFDQVDEQAVDELGKAHCGQGAGFAVDPTQEIVPVMQQNRAGR